MNYKTMDNETIHYDIEVGDIWLAADGGSYGHLVVGFHENGSDVIVRAFNKQGFENETRTIDGFKLTYRYSKADCQSCPQWALNLVWNDGDSK